MTMKSTTLLCNLQDIPNACADPKATPDVDTSAQEHALGWKEQPPDVEMEAEEWTEERYQTRIRAGYGKNDADNIKNSEKHGYIAGARNVEIHLPSEDELSEMILGCEDEGDIDDRKAARAILDDIKKRNTPQASVTEQEKRLTDEELVVIVHKTLDAYVDIPAGGYGDGIGWVVARAVRDACERRDVDVSSMISGSMKKTINR
jgi:hypothetical protein